MEKDTGELPLGLGMALAQHPDALEHYAALSEAEKQEVLAAAHSVRSREEMRAFVERLGNRTF